jgi:hypothetical protein
MSVVGKARGARGTHHVERDVIACGRAGARCHARKTRNHSYRQRNQTAFHAFLLTLSSFGFMVRGSIKATVARPETLRVTNSSHACTFSLATIVEVDPDRNPSAADL